MTIKDALLSKLTERETDGANRSPFIDHINAEVGVAMGSSWCSSFVSWGFREANGGKRAPWESGSSQAIKRWFESQGLLSHNVQDLASWEGAMFGWTDDNDAAHGHIGLVLARYTDGNGIIQIGSCEGNTSGGGSSNGDGVYQHRRAVPISNGHSLYFMNIGAQPGCSYWWPGSQ